MAHHVEPMDVDNSVCDFDNKENSLHHNNALARGPCTEKGYEELEVSELNMKLRYSITPTSSPMSKSLTLNCIDNKHLEAGDNNLSNAENANLTRSMNSTIPRGECVKKVLPLQSLPTDLFIDGNRNALRPLEPTVVLEKDIITVSGANNFDEQLSIPSSSSSLAHTPEATTPTKEFNKHDNSSPIMRGLKSVFNIFRPSQSPITISEDDYSAIKPEALSPPVINSPNTSDTPSTMLVSTPIAAQKTALAKRDTPNRDSIVFKDDLENELEWKDDSTIIFSTEKIPIHKLFMTQNKPVVAKSSTNVVNEMEKTEFNEKLDSTVEYMDISNNDIIVQEKTVMGTEEISNKNDITNVTDSDSEFLDCETTFSKTDNKNNVSLDSKHDGKVKGGQNENLDTTVTSESVNDTFSKTHDLLMLSAKSSKISATKEIDVTHVVEKNPVSLSQPEAETLLAVKCTEQVSPSCDIQLDIGSHIYSNTNQIDNLTLSIDNRKLSENIVVSSLSQIPLIADPRVLLFNIPDEISETAQTMQNVEDLNAIPANIPLPDDEDLERVVVNEETDKEKQVPNDENLKIIDQRHINETICTKLSDIELSSEKIPINIGVENKLYNEQHEQIKVTESVKLEKNCANENKVIEADVSINTNATESLPDLAQVENKDDTLKQYVVDEVTFIPEVEVISSRNVIYSETGNKNSLTVVDNVQVDVHQEGLPLIETKKTPPPTSDIEHNNDFIKNQTKNVIKSDFADVEPVHVILPTVERVLDEKINSSILNLHDEKQYLITKQNVTYSETRNENSLTVVNNEHVDVHLEGLPLKETKEMPPSTSEIEHCSDFIQNDTNNVIESDVAYVKTVEVILPMVERVPDEKINSPISSEYSTNSNFKEDIGIEVSRSAVEIISEKELQLEKQSREDNIISTEIRQEIVQFEDKITDGVRSNNEIVASTASPILNSVKQEETSAQKSMETLPEKTISTIEAKMETHVEENLVASKDNSPFVAISADDLEESPNSQDFNVLVASEASPISNSIKQEQTLAQILIETVPETTISTIEIKSETHLEENNVAFRCNKDNSPFVAISSDDLEDLKSQEHVMENVYNPNTKNNIDLSPPLSPKIVSKGYNLNFDEIVDPFATKTKISLLPSRDNSPDKSFENIEINFSKQKLDMIKNRPKSQPARKKLTNTKQLNSTFSGICKTSIGHQASDQTKVFSKETKTTKPIDIAIKNDVTEKNAKCDDFSNANYKTLETEKDAETVNETQDTDLDKGQNASSSQLSTYQPEEASSCEMRVCKNVFNLPEIDDAKFNPFVTKSNVLQSPVPLQQIDNPFVTKNQIKLTQEANDISGEIETEKATTKDHNQTSEQATCETKCLNLEEQKAESFDTSNTTCSSKATNDKDITTPEVHTEDEDTIEGPFLEAEGLHYDDKMCDFGGENDVIQFSELQTQESDNQEVSELFIDAEAFEFLLNQNKENEITDSGKESLFLKFDPLYSKRMSSDGVVAALNRVQKKTQSTPIKIIELAQNDITFDKSPVAEPHNVTEDSIDDLNITVTKPMMVVNPEVNPVPAPRNKVITPVRSNRQSLTFTSPAIAVIDRLLSLSSNNSLIGHEVSVTEVRGHSEADLALTQLRELLADKEISVYNLKSESKELKERLSVLKSQLKNLEALSEERLKKINDLNEKLAEKTKINRSMASVVEEYERTIASLIAETEQDRKRHAKERLQLINERDEQTRHLASMEVSFSDLHSKYEKSKQVIFGFKTNEDSLKKNLKDFEENFEKMRTNYELLKQHATSKLNNANEELQKMNRAHETEVLKLNAMIKRQELHITSLEETLLQKTKANEELSAICDELLNRVG